MSVLRKIAYVLWNRSQACHSNSIAIGSVPYNLAGIPVSPPPPHAIVSVCLLILTANPHVLYKVGSSCSVVWYKHWKYRRWWEVHGPSRGECSTSHHLSPFQCLTFFLKPVARLRFGDFCRRRFGDFRLQNWFSSPIRSWEVKHWSSK